MDRGHWITEGFTVGVEDTFYIHLTDWEEQVCDVVPHHIYQVAEADYNGDYFEAHQDIVGENLQCINIIQDITYVEDAYEEGDEFYFMTEDEDIFERLLTFAPNAYGVELSFNDMDEITVKKRRFTDSSIGAIGIR